MSIIEKLSDTFTEDNFEGFKKIVDGLKNIDFKDPEWEQTPLVMIGSKLGLYPERVRYAEYLLDKGAKIDQTCGSMSPLGDAAQKGLLKWMMVLICRGADINYCEGNYPPILRAIGSDQPEVVKMLLQNPKFDINLTIEAAYGDSLAKFAREKKAKKCIELFKELKIK